MGILDEPEQAVLDYASALGNRQTASVNASSAIDALYLPAERPRVSSRPRDRVPLNSVDAETWFLLCYFPVRGHLCRAFARRRREAVRQAIETRARLGLDSKVQASRENHESDRSTLAGAVFS